MSIRPNSHSDSQSCHLHAGEVQAYTGADPQIEIQRVDGGRGAPLGPRHLLQQLAAQAQRLAEVEQSRRQVERAVKPPE